MLTVFGRFLRRWHGTSVGPIQAAKDAGRRVFKVPVDIRVSLEEHGVVFLHIGKGTVLRANATGRRIMELLLEQRELGDIAQQMSTEYSLPFTQIERDVQAFVDSLQANGLVTVEN